MPFCEGNASGLHGIVAMPQMDWADHHPLRSIHENSFLKLLIFKLTILLTTRIEKSPKFNFDQQVRGRAETTMTALSPPPSDTQNLIAAKLLEQLACSGAHAKSQQLHEAQWGNYLDDRQGALAYIRVCNRQAETSGAVATGCQARAPTEDTFRAGSQPLVPHTHYIPAKCGV